MSRSSIILIIFITFSLFVFWKKPTCREGYIAMFVFADGWSCTPGYKPQ
jgi:hypothetical protein